MSTTKFTVGYHLFALCNMHQLLVWPKYDREKIYPNLVDNTEWRGDFDAVDARDAVEQYLKIKHPRREFEVTFNDNTLDPTELVERFTWVMKEETLEERCKRLIAEVVEEERIKMKCVRQGGFLGGKGCGRYDVLAFDSERPKDGWMKIGTVEKEKTRSGSVRWRYFYQGTQRGVEKLRSDAINGLRSCLVLQSVSKSVRSVADATITTGTV